MGLQIKISGGTPKAGKSLCLSCKNAKIVRGQNCEERITCNSGNLWESTRGVVTFRVSECGEFHPVNMPWKYEMEEMAWIVSARRRGPAGFQPEDGEMEVTITAPKQSQSDTPDE